MIVVAQVLVAVVIAAIVIPVAILFVQAVIFLWAEAIDALKGNNW